MNKCDKKNSGERLPRLFTLVALASVLALPPAALQAWQATAPQQPPPGVDIKIQAQPLKATVGDPIWIDIDFTLPQGYQLQFPALPEQLGEFTVLETFPGPTIPSQQAGAKPVPAPQAPGSQNPGSIHHLARIVAALYRTGEFEFPALPVTLKGKDGKLVEMLTPSVKIQIESVLDEKDLNLKDLKKQAEIAEPNRWLLWLTLGAVAIILLLIAWWWMKRRRRPAFLPAVQPEVDPLDQAEADLRELLGQGHLDKGMVKQFYVRMSEIMKRALEASYEIQTIEKTTSEIMAALTHPPEDGGAHPEPACLELVETLLLSCDMVKFARYIPSRAESDEAAAMAIQILVDCKERRQPAASGEVSVAGVP